MTHIAKAVSYKQTIAGLERKVAALEAAHKEANTAKAQRNWAFQAGWLEAGGDPAKLKDRVWRQRRSEVMKGAPK